MWPFWNTKIYIQKTIKISMYVYIFIGGKTTNGSFNLLSLHKLFAQKIQGKFISSTNKIKKKWRPTYIFNKRERMIKKQQKVAVDYTSSKHQMLGMIKILWIRILITIIVKGWKVICVLLGEWLGRYSKETTFQDSMREDVMVFEVSFAFTRDNSKVGRNKPRLMLH